MKPHDSGEGRGEPPRPDVLEGEVEANGAIRLTNGTLPPGTKVWAVPQRADGSDDLSNAWARHSLRTLSQWARENPF